METETRWILLSLSTWDSLPELWGPRQAGPPARIKVRISISKENSLTAEVFRERPKLRRKWRGFLGTHLETTLSLSSSDCFSHPQWWIIYWPTHPAIPTSCFYLPSLRNTFQNCWSIVQEHNSSKTTQKTDIHFIFQVSKENERLPRSLGRESLIFFSLTHTQGKLEMEKRSISWT